MKIKNIILLIILIISFYFTIEKPLRIFKPFYAIKDLFFSIVHADSKEIELSKDLEESIINNLKEDNDNLKKLTKINLSISDFDLVNATVISRNRDYWFNTLTINKGKSDGIDIDMAVIDSNGLIGRINMITENTSTVKLITTNDTKNKVSAIIRNKDNDIYGIINGYDSNNKVLYLTITENIDIKKDSKVETTGMGGVFPSGILIGNVVDVIKKEDDVTRVVRVKPISNIEGERYVSVLLRKKVSNN